ncbi:AMP-binding protein, partial [Enterococcus sp. HPCN18]
IGDVELLSDAERAELLVSVSASDSTALRGSNQLVPQRLAAAVEDDPEAVAVVVDGVDFTYQDVDARSSRLARHLINCGLGSGDQVSISGLTG